MRLHRSYYFLFGVSVLALVFTLFSTKNIFFETLSSFWAIDRTYTIFTGLALVFLMIWQWRLFWLRRVLSKPDSANELKYHRWVGIAFVSFLLLHAGDFGFRLKSFLSTSIIIIAFTGLFYAHMLSYKSRQISKIWDIIHIGLSAFLIPLILLHAWAGFVFK